MHVRLSKLAPAALLVVASCATDTSPPEGAWELRSRSQAISGGRTDEDHKNVVGIFSIESGGMCSGSLIAPNLVLTAQHCVAEVPSEFVICGSTQFGAINSADSFYITTDTQFSPGGTLFRGKSVEVAPGGRDLCGDDVALIFLTSNVPSSVTEPIIPRIDLTAQEGERYSAHGYGDDGTGSFSAAGTRRWITARSVFCDGADCGPIARGQLEDNEWVGSAGTCQGDSGGPAIDEAGRVFGVLSRGGDGCSSSVYSGVDDWSDWIRDAAMRAAEEGGYAPAAWVTTGSSDATIADDDADGVVDDDDNCPSVENTDQADRDGDGAGDACDPIDDRQRGGACDICDGCVTSDDCVDRGSVCMDLGNGGVCTRPCVSADDCPDTATCFAIPVGGGVTTNVCLNENAGHAGACEASWICGGSVVNPPSEGCDVCEPCTTDAGCLYGSCLDFGSGGVCTRDCEDGVCPGDAACFQASGRFVCLNPDAGSAGVCPAGYVCRDPAPVDPSEGSEDTGGGDGEVVATTRKQGCAASGQAAGGGEGAVALLVLGLVSASRRRRR
ncbi:MAG: S1 family peptidase [Myxococcales bacterium]|nr:S1 family peptidase [Myxococcales bacterium]MCB9533986.1 S1 family peptidase [Myxococcales bacterium]